MSITDTAWLTDRGKAIAADPEFALDARHAAFTCLLEADDRRYLLNVDRGRLSITDAADARSWDFAVRGSAEAWDRYINNDPDLAYRDVLGMAFQGTMSVTGEVSNHLVFEGNEQKLYANLQPLYVFLSKLKKH